MPEFSVSVENLLALAQEQEQQQQYLQALTYLKQAYELDDQAAVTLHYLQVALAADKLVLAQELLATTTMIDYFCQEHDLEGYRQLLWQAHGYLLVDQAPDVFTSQDYQLSPAEQTATQQWQAKLAQVIVAPEQLQHANDLLKQALLKPLADHQLNLAPLLSLPPSSYVQVVQPILQNPLLLPFLRMQILVNLQRLSRPVTVSLFWRGQLRQLTNNELLAVDQLPVYQEMMQYLTTQLDSGQLVYSNLSFAQSNLVTYLLLTYPFCEQELRPLSNWQEFLTTGQVAADLSSAAKDQIAFWQEQEQQLLRAANQ
ncbi:hypothetical protein [Lapidilactobacillus wuchangensis]|uniref:hypothetical protein n=1 Tax=Lapidilactobacillus wuchangensis TaxID=2486001 RepID=UPI000F79484B|nr:hypothetical protein [Lapidilactobacillus wuchangensis]